MSLPTNYQGALYTQNEVNQMREWCKDCHSEWQHEFIDEASNEKILKVTDLQYSGGLTAFVKECRPVEI